MKDLPLSEDVQKRIEVTKQELLGEQKIAFTTLGIALPESSL